jgi:hypothetical protein
VKRRKLIGAAIGSAGLMTHAGRLLARGDANDTMEANAVTTLQDDIQTVLDTYVERWNDYDVDTMQTYWDHDEQEPIYVAEEMDPLRGWPALEAYWRGSDPATTQHMIVTRDLSVSEIAPGVAHAFWHMNWNVYFSTEKLYSKPIGGEVRVTALLRKKPDGWRFFHWIEAPLASLIQLKRAHEQAVDPRLLAKLKAQGIEF